jgi:hypothetical protein
LTELKKEFGDIVRGMICDASNPSDIKSIVAESLKDFRKIRKETKMME